MLDVDGVIDRRIFGFPSTTAAGVEALSLFHTRGISVALNTARSADEVKDYCAAYGLNGGVAEYGSYLWDAIAQQGQVLVSAEGLSQLDRLRTHLQQLPGVFLDERHRTSIKAFTYRERPRGLVPSLTHALRASSIGDGALAPLPSLTINRVMADLQLDRLVVHQTSIDTTIVAKDMDKGTGLVALRDRFLDPGAQIIAVGDSEADLAMFRVATRSFAPANVSCGQQARLLGCRIAKASHQRGLLEIANEISAQTATVPPSGERQAGKTEALSLPKCDLFFDLLRAADKGLTPRLLGAIFSRSVFKGLFR